MKKNYQLADISKFTLALTFLSIFIYQCLQTDPGIVKLYNQSGREYYYKIVVGDSLDSYDQSIVFDSDSPPYPTLKKDEVVRNDLRDRIKKQSKIYLLLFSAKAKIEGQSKQMVLKTERTEAIGLKYLESSNWNLIIYQ